MYIECFVDHHTKHIIKYTYIIILLMRIHACNITSVTVSFMYGYLYHEEWPTYCLCNVYTAYR